MTDESRPYQPHPAPALMSQVERQDGLTTPGKGLIFGECGTTGCTNKARWIPTSDIPVAPQPFIYRCPECCDRIDDVRGGLL